MRGTLLSLFIFLTLLINAQSPGDWWYFGGNAGLFFPQSGSPVLDSLGRIYTNEGCASISDQQGQLLFYTDGTSVFDRGHNGMPEGHGLTGNSTSTQSSIIVPMPGSVDKYYIFSVYDELAYSVVDMTQNSGFGAVDVNTKNVPLASNLTEKLIACKNRSGLGYWVIVHERNSAKFLAFEVTQAGVNPTAVTSILGDIHSQGFLGYMKISPDRSKLVSANNQVDNMSVQLFDFDNASGKVSGTKEIDHWENRSPYGAEFSPNGRFLYISEEKGTSNIYQYDISIGDTASINASEFRLPNSTDVVGGALQIGPDKRIYHVRFGRKTVNAINYPDSAGLACGYERDKLSLKSKQGFFGLPNQIPRLLHVVVNIENPCQGKLTKLSIAPLIVDSIKWDFGDSASGTLNHANGREVEHIFSDTGTFVLSIKIYKGSTIESITSEVYVMPTPNVDLGMDTTICIGDSVFIDLGDSGKDYLWHNGSTDSSIVVTEDTLISVTVTDVCQAMDQRKFTLIPVPQLKVDAPTSICENEQLTIDATSLGISVFEWSTGNDSSQITIDSSGTYWVEGTHACGVSREVIIVDRCECVLWIPNAFHPNGSGRNDDFKPIIDCPLASWDFSIYDRWGQQIFRTDDHQAAWDGKKSDQLSPEGAYAWKLEYAQMVNGRPKPASLHGVVFLIH